MSQNIKRSYESWTTDARAVDKNVHKLKVFYEKSSFCAREPSWKFLFEVTIKYRYNVQIIQALIHSFFWLLYLCIIECDLKLLGNWRFSIIQCSAADCALGGTGVGSCRYPGVSATWMFVAVPLLWLSQIQNLFTENNNTHFEVVCTVHHPTVRGAFKF